MGGGGASRRALLFVPVALMVLLATMASDDHIAEASSAGDIGVNWGTMASHTLNPYTVTNLLKDNGIKKVKLFDADSWTVSTLAGTNIQTIVAIPNDQLKTFAESYDDAKDWVKENVTKHLFQGGVDIRYVAVGNEPFLSTYNGSYIKLTYPAMVNIKKALDDAGHGQKVKVTTPLNADVYDSSSNQPSDGQFRKDIHSAIKDIVQFLDDNKSPFMVNIYPFLSLYQNPNFPVDYAFFDGGGRTITDKGKTYTNVFDANYDTLIWSLKKMGVNDMKIIVGEVGWPTDGNINANTKLAKRFYDGLFKKLANKEGTPMRPHEDFDIYIFSLFDEDMKSIAPGFFERHWGIFRYDGMPKFPMDFSGEGNDKMLIAAKQVVYQEHKWCVLKDSVKKLSEISSQIDYACAQSDCTSLGYGSSCNNLDKRGNVSYAFNMYFQMQDQNVEACDFKGTAEIVSTNVSTGTCLFPIQIYSAGERLKLANFSWISLVLGLIMSFFLLV